MRASEAYRSPEGVPGGDLGPPRGLRGTPDALQEGGSLPDVQPEEKHRCFLITRAEGEGGLRVCPGPSQRRQPGQRPPSCHPRGPSCPQPGAPTPGLLLLFSWARGYLMNLSDS